MPIARPEDATWIAKARGLPGFEDGEIVQLLRTLDGPISPTPVADSARSGMEGSSG